MRLFLEKGDYCDFGCDEVNLANVIDSASLKYPNTPLCAVKNWSWWDYQITDDLRDNFDDAGVQPAIIYAEFLLFDERNRWPSGSIVKSTPLKVFEDGYYFVTRNTVYILVGQGTRKLVDPRLVANILL